MPTITQKNDHTLVSLANRMQNKVLIDVFQGMEEENEILEDLPFYEANGGMKHTEASYTSLPRAEWGLLGGYWGSGKAEVRQFEEDVAKMSLYSKVPVDIARASGNAAKYRRDEDTAIGVGLSSQMAEAIFYGNRLADPTQPIGLANRYAALSQGNVYDAGGTAGRVTSVWVVKNDRKSFFGLFRQGSKAGMSVRDLGESTEVDTDTGKERQVYRTLFDWEVGMAVRDERYVARIANIPVPEDVTDSTAWVEFEKILIKVLNSLPGRNPNGLRIYCNSDIMTQMDINALDKNNVNWTPGEVHGRPTMFFRGRVPIRRVDALLSTEDIVA